jgi:hypothetical protein
LLLGVLQPDGGFHCFVQPRCSHAVLRQWRRGFPVKDLFLVATNDGIDFEAWRTCMALGQLHTPTEDAAGALKRAAR